MAKNLPPHSGSDLSTVGPNSGHQNFFFENLALLVVRYHGKLPSCTISKKKRKKNDPMLRKFSERGTDRQTEKKDLIERWIGQGKERQGNNNY